MTKTEQINFGSTLINVGEKALLSIRNRTTEVVIVDKRQGKGSASGVCFRVEPKPPYVSKGAWLDSSFFTPLNNQKNENYFEIFENQNEAYKAGEGAGQDVANYSMAQQMRVLFCALVSAHKRKDSCAFYATVEIVKTVLSQHANFDEDDWAVFRNDNPRKNIDN